MKAGFWANVEMEPNSGCWLWSGKTRSNKRGLTYGSFYADRKNWPAHRYAHTMTVGPVAKELVMDHLCRTTLCVNPQHLEPVTHIENCQRGLVGINQREKTHCPYGHEYTPENTYSYRGYRYCRACNPRLMAEKRARRLTKVSHHQGSPQAQRATE